jgi:hypothetical protein
MVSGLDGSLHDGIEPFHALDSPALDVTDPFHALRPLKS